jgi:hypothetical protein
MHPLFNTLDVYGQGKPTRLANLPQAVDTTHVVQPPGSLPVAEGIQQRTYYIPWFKHYRPRVIEQYATAFRKVAERFEELIVDDPGDPPEIGSWGLTRRREG